MVAAPIELNDVTTPATEWLDVHLASAARLLHLMIGEILKGCSTDEEAVRVDDRKG